MKDLLIPEKISLESEIITGIRRKDVKKLVALAVPGAAIGIAVWLLNSNPMVQFISMIVTFGYLFLCYVVVARVEGTPSVLNYLELLIRFHREQQHFYYKQRKETLYYVSDVQSASEPPEADYPGLSECGSHRE